MDPSIPLSSDEIVHFCQSMPLLNRAFYGVVTPSALESLILPSHSFVILYFDNKNSSLGHWTVLLKNKHTFEFFDSSHNWRFLAQVRDILNLVYSHPLIRSIPFATQDFRTKTCGYFCLYFILNRLKRLKLSFGYFIYKYFYLDTFDNEYTIAQFCKKYEL